MVAKLPLLNISLTLLIALAYFSTSLLLGKITDTISFANKDVAIDMGESVEFTMICWCEHDAVYSNSDEVNLDLAHLAAGVPHEQYKLDYYFTQID